MSIFSLKRWSRRGRGGEKSKVVLFLGFVIEHVENSLQQEEDPTYKPRGGISQRDQRIKKRLK